MIKCFTIAEFIRQQQKLQKLGYKLVDYNEYTNTEKWQAGENEIVLKFISRS